MKWIILLLLISSAHAQCDWYKDRIAYMDIKMTDILLQIIDLREAELGRKRDKQLKKLLEKEEVFIPDHPYIATPF